MEIILHILDTLGGFDHLQSQIFHMKIRFSYLIPLLTILAVVRSCSNWLPFGITKTSHCDDGIYTFKFYDLKVYVSSQSAHLLNIYQLALTFRCYGANHVSSI